MFPIKLLTEPLPPPQADGGVEYVVAKDGLYKRISNPLYTAVVKAECGQLQELKESCQLKVPKFPLDMLREVESFFAAIYERHQSEAVVVLIYHLDDGWDYVIPLQETKGLHVDYDMTHQVVFQHALIRLQDLHDAGWMIFGTIHSHAAAGAFHSGTDDKDDEHTDGLHITIGSFNQPQHTYAARWIMQGTEFKTDMADAVESEDLPAPDPMWLSQVRLPAPQVAYPMGCWRDHSDADNYDESLWRQKRWEEGTAETKKQSPVTPEQEMVDAQAEWEDYWKKRGVAIP